MDIADHFCQANRMRLSFSAVCCVFTALWIGQAGQSEELLVTKQSLIEINPGMWAAAKLTPPQRDADQPLIGPQNKLDGARLLRILHAKHKSNGFKSILYDNRDRGHSTLKPDLYPALLHLKYGPGLRARNLDTGLAGRIVFPAVVFGNSSTAVTQGYAPRSLPRLAMTSPAWREVTPVLYANNHIYVYPEHRDYDEADQYPLNWPYMIVSQGSSRSDIPFLNAIALTLAALPADTFEALRKNGLIAPTVQMIMRRNLKGVTSREAYLSGAAHPPVFDGRRLQMARMVEQASRLRPEHIPPMVRLRVAQEDFSANAGLAGLSEHFYDTPAAIGRIWRNFSWQNEMVVTAEDTKPLDGQPLTFEWRLLQGDPERVMIEPIGPGGQTANIRIKWHDPWLEPIPMDPTGTQRRMSRVDIGVFASNGTHDSAPSMISIDFPVHQLRRYATQSDGVTRLVSIDYNSKGRGAYFDPLLYWSAAWTDTARYDETGVRLLGWDRRNADGTQGEFVPEEAGSSAQLYALDMSNKGVPTLLFKETALSGATE